MSPEILPTGWSPTTFALARAASTVVLTCASTGYCAISSASLVVTRGVVLAELSITLPVAVS